jgi:hypothetical protein
LINASLVALGLALTAAPADAAVPGSITHQGRLYDAESAPVKATLDVTFTIYDGPNEGAAAVWTETHSVAFDDGYFSVELGLMKPFDAQVFDGSVRHLGIQVGGDEEMSPRAAVRSVPYALMANDVNGDIHPLSVSIQGVGVVINESGQWVGDPAGLQGPAGPQGPTGAAGAAGPTGPQGIMGATGPEGAMGPAGPAGLQGFMGATGPAGAMGPVGPTGAMGPAGATRSGPRDATPLRAGLPIKLTAAGYRSARSRVGGRKDQIGERSCSAPTYQDWAHAVRRVTLSVGLPLQTRCVQSSNLMIDGIAPDVGVVTRGSSVLAWRL